MKKSLFFIAVLLCGTYLFSQNKSASQLRDNTDDSSLAQLAALQNAADVQAAMSNPDYKVTAGDVYTLAYAAGSNAVKYTILVDSTYKVRVSNLAVVDATGKTFLELKKQVEDIVTKNYPLSGVQFALTTPSSFKVTVKGEVVQTQEKKAWPLTRLSDVLIGCDTPHSSIRDICVTSTSGKIKYYDLYKALRDGDLKENPYLRPGDVITVKKAERIVTVTGAVDRVGTYQLVSGDTIKELLEYYAGGAEVFANVSNIEITRYADSNYREGQKIYLNYETDKKFALLDGDEILVQSYKDLKPVIFFEGAIGSAEGIELDASTKKRIQFEQGTDYTFLIRKYASYFTAVSDIENAYIIRGDQIIPIDLSKILYDSSYNAGISVQAYDTLRIPFKQYFVSVAGSVVTPGRYPYIPDRTWEYYIGLAGGFIKTQNNHDAIKIVDINGKELSKTDIITPETTITAETNSGLYYFNIWAPVVTTILSIISTTLSILAVSGVFK